MRLGILVPSLDMVQADWVACLSQLLVALMSTRVEGVGDEFRFMYFNQRGSLVMLARQDLLERAIDKGMTHVLWLDSDMVFHGGLFHDLWNTMRKGSHACVAANYVKKCIPTTSNAQSLDGKMLISSKHHTGTEEALSVGMGACLMDCAKIKDLPKPWFATPWVQEPDGSEHFIGEDVYFFRKLHKLTGEHVIIDHDASQHVGHIGTFCYDNSLVDINYEGEDMKEIRAKMVAN